VGALIVVEQKQLDEIASAISEFDRVLIVGCDGCSGIYQVGGEKQAQTLAQMLDLQRKVKHSKDINAKATTVLRQCDRQIVATSLRPLVDEYEAVITLGCGAGAQTLANVFDKKLIIPGVNTKFIGAQDRESGSFYELCSACGDCLLLETGGICPLTRCAKALLNGPCGGQSKGKCEVGGWKNDCAWVLIYNRLKERGRLDLFTKFRLPKDFRDFGHPRQFQR
jgi:hypothetical protein